MALDVTKIGTTTGRGRRTGWFDAVASRYSATMNSVSSVALTRLDVLDPFPSISVCTSYKIDGQHVTTPPASISAFGRAVPEFEEMAGWQEDCTSARKFDQLRWALRKQSCVSVSARSTSRVDASKKRKI